METQGQEKHNPRMMDATAYKTAMWGKTRKTQSCEELKHKQIQTEQRNEKTTARSNSPKTSNRNMPAMTQTH